ncbi:MAG: HEAT repeat domain-containing protein, partial [Myxococcota bacterium]
MGQRLPLRARTLLQQYKQGTPTQKRIAEKQLVQIGRKTLHTYVFFERASHSKNWELRRFAVQMIGKILPGEDIIPYVQRASRDPDPRIRQAAFQALRKLGLMGLSAHLAILDQNRWWNMRWQATQAIAEIGPPAAVQALPILRDTLRRESSIRVKLGILEALGALGPKAIPILRHTLILSPNRVMRLTAARALASMGQQASPAVRELTRATQDKDLAVRQEATRALSRVGPRAIPGLIRVMQFSHNAQERRIAAKALGKLGPSAANALSKIKLNNKEPDLEVQRTILRAMAKMGSRAVPKLIYALEYAKHWKLRWQAAHSLRQMSKSAAPASKRLWKALQHEKHPSVQQECAHALGAIGLKSTLYLSRMLTHPSWRIQQIAAQHLHFAETLNPLQKKQMFQRLHNVALSKHQEAARAAAIALSKQPPSAFVFQHQVLQQTTQPTIQEPLLQTLQRLGRKASPAARTLSKI